MTRFLVTDRRGGELNIFIVESAKNLDLTLNLDTEDTPTEREKLILDELDLNLNYSDEWDAVRIEYLENIETKHIAGFLI